MISKSYQRAVLLMEQLSGLACHGDDRNGSAFLFLFGKGSGLEWRGYVSKDTGVHGRGKFPYSKRPPTLELPLKDRFSHVARIAAPEVIAVHNHWQEAIARALESLPKTALEQFFGVIHLDRLQPPQDLNVRENDKDPKLITLINLPYILRPKKPAWISHWEISSRDGQPYGWNWQCSLEEAIEELWDIKQKSLDPPGYVWTLAGEQRGIPFWTWAWGGADVTTSVCPKDRPQARADAWADFWKERRAAVLEPEEV